MTPEIGGAACPWGQTVLGVACAASKVTNMRRNSGCFIKMSFELPVVRTLAAYNAFLRIMMSSPKEDCALRVPDGFGCDAQLRLSLKRRDKSIGRWSRSIRWYQSARRALPRSKGLSLRETRWCFFRVPDRKVQLRPRVESAHPES